MLDGADHIWRDTELSGEMNESGDAVYSSPSGAGHLNKIKYTEAQLGATAILGCCKGYAWAISWVFVIKGIF